MEFIKALEEEKNKILVFRRELPLSLQLISQAIQTYKHTLNIDDSEIIASEVPVLEEFLPLRPSCSSLEEFLPLRPSCSSLEEEINNNNSNDDTININDGKRDNVPDWLKSAQLWNEQPEPIVILQILFEHKNYLPRPSKKGITQYTRFHRRRRFNEIIRQESVNNQAGGGALDTVEIETSLNLALTNSNGNGNVYEGNQGDGSHKEGKEGNSNRKSRRSWSPGLHRRFLTVLQELGGPYVSTPKMIRELMKVDDLTNDEVKSHLQKYRLHIRRSRTKSTQVVLVSNTWASPSEYAVSTIGTIPSSQAMQQQSSSASTISVLQ